MTRNLYASPIRVRPLPRRFSENVSAEYRRAFVNAALVRIRKLAMAAGVPPYDPARDSYESWKLAVRATRLRLIASGQIPASPDDVEEVLAAASGGFAVLAPQARRAA